MAFFKFRKGGDGQAAAAAPAETVEVLRRRARNRLVGALVLVVLGVVGFPLLFDTQPRPIPVDIPIQIPDKTRVKPLDIPVAGASKAEAVSARSSLDAREQLVSADDRPAKPDSRAEPKPQPKSDKAAPPAPKASPASDHKAEPKTEHKVTEARPKPETKPERTDKPKASEKAADKASEKSPAQDKVADGPGTREAAKAQALLDGKEPEPTAPGAPRYIVQVGAFADATKARETRLKVERAGLTTYTHVAETKDGKRIRVRVGPFAHKAEAEKAASKIKGLDLPAAILTL